MKHLIFIILVLLICVSGLFAKKFKIGVIVDGSSTRVEQIEKLIQREILDLTSIEFDVSFPADKRVDGRWDKNTIEAGLSQLLADPEVDLVITLGVAASHLISRRGNLEKPAIAPFIIDAKLQGLPIKKGHSDVKNLCFVNIPSSVNRDLVLFLDLTSAKNLAILINPLYLQAIPEFGQRFADFSSQRDVIVQEIPVTDNIDRILESISADAEGVYVTGLVHLADAKFDQLITGISDRGLPSITFLGRADVEKGVLTTLRGDFFARISRRIALNTQRIFLGEKAHKIPVDFPLQEQLIVNMKTARLIGFYPPWNFLSDAELLYDEPVERGELISLNQVVAQALKNNLGLAGQKYALVSGQQEVNRARTALFPQLSAGATGLIIDKDRAEASFGNQAERSLTGSLNASQLIFAEGAWANLSIQNSLQRSRVAELRLLELDITLSASTAYINLLRARAFERIEKDNLNQSRKNYAQALVRQSVGTAGPAEVFRWESQISANRSSMLKAEAQTNLARLELNKILHRPLETAYQYEELDSTSTVLQRSTFIADRYVSNPRLFQIFRDFMVVLTLENAQELKAIDAAIAAQDRALSSIRNSFWAPTIALQGQYSSIFEKDGAGSSGGFSFPGVSIPTADDDNWSVALNLSLPLFSGGERFVAGKQANEELNRLNVERQALVERLEQRTRAAVYQAGASFSTIEETKNAEQAAIQTLNIVEESYSQGAVNILDLLDAQNNALISELLAADAIYTFINDLMNVQRAGGMSYLSSDDESYQTYINRLNDYYTKNGIEIERLR
jgi:outer membrane protein TolC